MALISRLSRLFQADLHAVLDRIEEPDVLLRQAVREMEEELAGDEQRLKFLDHELKQLGNREAQLEQALGEIEEEIDICFNSDKEDLARALIRRKLEALRFRKFLAQKRETLEQTVTGLDTRLEENRARLDSMHQKAELLAQENNTVHVENSWNAPDIRIPDEDVEVAFIREKQRRNRP